MDQNEINERNMTEREIEREAINEMGRHIEDHVEEVFGPQDEPEPEPEPNMIEQLQEYSWTNTAAETTNPRRIGNDSQPIFYGRSINNLNTNNNNMLQEWLQAEFKSKVNCNVIYNPNNNPEPKKFGINIYDQAEYDSRPRFFPTEEIKSKVYGQMRVIDSYNAEMKIKLPGKKSKIVTNIKLRTFDLDEYEDQSEEGIKLIYPDELEFITRSSAIDKESAPIAMLEENNIIMFWGIKHRTPANIAIMKYVIDQALKLMNGRYDLIATKKHEEELFRNLILNFSSERSRTITTQLTESRNGAQNALEDYVDNTRREDTLLKELSLIKNQEKGIGDKAEKAIIYFDKVKKLEDWSIVNETSLQFIFKDLTMDHEEVEVKLPKYKVLLDINTGTFTIHLADDKHQINPCHPHVFQDNGRVCMGNFSTIYPQLVAAGNFPQTVDIMIQFLEAYNDDSPVIPFWKFIATMKLNKNWNDMTPKEKADARTDWLDNMGIEEGSEEDDRLNNGII